VIGWPHRIRRIGYGQNHVWSYVPKKNPQGFESYPKVLDGLPQRGGRLGRISSAARLLDENPACLSTQQKWIPTQLDKERDGP
jgi:hypothetical protein